MESLRFRKIYGLFFHVSSTWKLWHRLQGMATLTHWKRQIGKLLNLKYGYENLIKLGKWRQHSRRVFLLTGMPSKSDENQLYVGLGSQGLGTLWP